MQEEEHQKFIWWLSKKEFFAILALVFLIGASIGIFFWRRSIYQKAEEEASDERKVVEEHQLKDVEEKISTIEKQLEEISKITPEEKQKIEVVRGILSAEKATDDVKVEGVEITLSGSIKIIKNSAQGYSIEMPLNLLLARSVSSDFIEFHDRNFICQDSSCEPVIRIEAKDANPKEFTLDEWFADEERRAGPIYSPRERLTVGDKIVYKVTEIIPAKFEGVYYYWGRGKKIYSLRISSFDEPTYRKHIDTFELE